MCLNNQQLDACCSQLGCDWVSQVYAPSLIVPALLTPVFDAIGKGVSCQIGKMMLPMTKTYSKVLFYRQVLVLLRHLSKLSDKYESRLAKHLASLCRQTLSNTKLQVDS